MKISNILKNKKTLSFEVFPPKEDKSLEPLSETLTALGKFNPDFISCTYGAGGTNVGRSIEVCKMIKDGGYNVLPHFTCIGNSKENIDDYISHYEAIGVDNVLLLRGDLPKGWQDTRSSFVHASNLISHFKDNYSEMSIAAAAYPEIHMESASVDDDIKYLKLKHEEGAEFFITQLCHDVRAYDRFIKRIRKAGITIPVVIGLMPIITRDGTIKMSLTNGCSIPAPLSRIMGIYRDDLDAYRRAGKEYTIKLINEYLESDINGIHIYTLNKYKDIEEIIERAGLIKKLSGN
jgi:methylenetetrahydrofolate reductase (NADPH)